MCWKTLTDSQALQQFRHIFLLLSWILVLNVTAWLTAVPLSSPTSHGCLLLTGHFLNKHQIGFVKHHVTQSPSAHRTTHRFDSVPLSDASVENVDVLCATDDLQRTHPPFFLFVVGNTERDDQNCLLGHKSNACFKQCHDLPQSRCIVLFVLCSLSCLSAYLCVGGWGRVRECTSYLQQSHCHSYHSFPDPPKFTSNTLERSTVSW